MLREIAGVPGRSHRVLSTARMESFCPGRKRPAQIAAIIRRYCELMG